MESQLFGHVARIFSGAREHSGLLDRADGSTLFLDEIGEVPLAIQAKLLRVLETGQFWKIGANHASQVDIRLVTATNRDLAESVQQHAFRQDLYDRISVIPITLPPLRERREDIPLLLEHFLVEFNRTLGKRVSFSPAAIELLQQRSWPNNVRGLRRFVERAAVLADARTVVYSAAELARLLPAEAPPESVRAAWPEAGPGEHLEDILLAQGRANQAQLLRHLRRANGRQTKTEWARRVGLSRPVLRRELKDLIRFCLQHGVGLEFFQERVKLQPEDATSALGQESDQQGQG